MGQQKLNSPLSDYEQVFMPYCLACLGKSSRKGPYYLWIALNRGYRPLGYRKEFEMNDLYSEASEAARIKIAREKMLPIIELHGKTVSALKDCAVHIGHSENGMEMIYLYKDSPITREESYEHRLNFLHKAKII